MRAPLFILFVFVLNMFIAEYSSAAKVIDASVKTDESRIDFNKPPFWMFTYDEFADLNQEQKDFYLEKFLSKLKDIPLLQEVTKTELNEAAEWAASWKDLQVKLYRYCQDKQALKKCENIADVRLQALDLFSNQSEANRKANATQSGAK
ncbi:hypothetical protein [Bdellovibrio sp. HCB2-146]|uniref:hypothetical protein n=1 Tax=Bdellovibrio sp. HCB2-146 TaxID=3394362 RepID=UPI0039BD132A